MPGDFYLPAEWEPHQATWLSWPNRRGATFPDELLDEVLPSFYQLIEVLASAGETVAINISDIGERKAIEANISPRTLESVRFEQIPTNEPWCRDHGPTVLRNRVTGERRALCWNYNAWGEKYPPWDLDAAAAPQMAGSFQVKTRLCRELTIEGGSLESDGNGLLMISESSVVCERRNAGLSRGRLEARLLNLTGAREILWVNAEVPGDDTDGHVDCFARFAPENTILALDPDSADSTSPALETNARRLKEWARERSWTFAGLPIPLPVATGAGDVLPATYANFYIANEAVIVPVFDDPADEIAIDVIAEIFPGRAIVPFPAKQLIIGQGGIHCLTQPLPAS